MSDPFDVFIQGIQGKLLSQQDRYLYFFEWKAIFTIVASVVSLAVDIFIFHHAYGSSNFWLVFLFWIVLLVCESIKKYDAIYHKDPFIINAIEARVLAIGSEQGMPVPPDVQPSTSQVQILPTIPSDHQPPENRYD